MQEFQRSKWKDKHTLLWSTLVNLWRMRHRVKANTYTQTETIPQIETHTQTEIAATQTQEGAVMVRYSSDIEVEMSNVKLLVANVAIESEPIYTEMYHAAILGIEANVSSKEEVKHVDHTDDVLEW